MMLSDRSIIAARDQELQIEPWYAAQLQPCSYDVTLGTSFATLTQPGPVDPFDARAAEVQTVITDRYLIRPGQLLLATTVEKVTLGPQIAARLEGKSSLARLGLLVHTAGFIDAGFTGQITLEISNLSGREIWLSAYMPIAQLCFFRLDRPAEKPYAGSYQGQDGVTASRYFANRRPR